MSNSLRSTSPPIHTLLLACLTFGLLSCAGCRGKNAGPTIFVPEQDTAVKQYLFAEHEHRKAVMPALREVSKSRKLKRIVAGYQAVIDRFPEDREFVAFSKKKLCETYFFYGKINTSLNYVNQLLAEFSDMEQIDAWARLYRGKCLEEKNRKAEAQAIYKEVLDLYEESKDESIQEIVAFAKKRYNRVIELPGG